MLEEIDCTDRSSSKNINLPNILLFAQSFNIAVPVIMIIWSIFLIVILQFG